jgi:hypothetical protein
MPFDDYFEIATDELFSSDFASVATYGGNDIYCHIQEGENLDEGGQVARAEIDLLVLKSDVPSPAYRDTFTINSVDWTFSRILKGDSKTHTLRLFRDERLRIM